MFSQFSIHPTFYRFVKFDKFDRWNYGKPRLFQFSLCSAFDLFVKFVKFNEWNLGKPRIGWQNGPMCLCCWDLFHCLNTIIVMYTKFRAQLHKEHMVCFLDI